MRKISSKKLMIVLVSVVALIVVVLIAFQVGLVIMRNHSDGLDNFTGIEREAAEYAVEYDHGFDGDYPFRYEWSKPVVEDVFPTPESEKRKLSQCADNDNPNEIRYYSIVVARVGLFGYTEEPVTYVGCKIVG